MNIKLNLIVSYMGSIGQAPLPHPIPFTPRHPTNIYLKECYYYTSRTHCPFENLGCTFGHGTSIQVEDTKENIDDISELLNDLDSDTLVGKGFKENIETSFCTSTPLKNRKQLLKCKDCLYLFTVDSM